MRDYKEKLNILILCKLEGRWGIMFNNLGIVIEALSDTELKVYNSVDS